jgi:integrase
MFATAVEEGVIRWSPAAIRVLVGPSKGSIEGEDKAKALTRPQLDRLLGELPEYWGLFFEVLAEYGLRVGDAIELRWQDVEIPDCPLIVGGVQIGGYLHVRRRFYRGRIGTPKAGSRRTLKMSLETAQRLSSLRGAPDDLIFQTDGGRRIGTSNLMSRVLKPVAVRAGIGSWVETEGGGTRAETWVGFHTFRHTCATLKMREEHWTLKDVQLFLGHSNYATTERYYAHLEAQDAPAPASIRGGKRVASQPTEIGRDQLVPLRPGEGAHAAS